MKNERTKILEQLSRGEITVEQADEQIMSLPTPQNQSPSQSVDNGATIWMADFDDSSYSD